MGLYTQITDNAKKIEAVETVLISFMTQFRKAFDYTKTSQKCTITLWTLLQFNVRNCIEKKKKQPPNTLLIPLYLLT